MSDSPTIASAEKYIYRAQCQSCRRAINIDLVKLRDTLGADYLIDNIRSRLVCTCGAREPITTIVLAETTVGIQYRNMGETTPES
jgi:hypothetical protein